MGQMSPCCSLTFSLIHSLAHWFTHSLIYSLAHWFTRLLTDSLTCSLLHSFTSHVIAGIISCIISLFCFSFHILGNIGRTVGYEFYRLPNLASSLLNSLCMHLEALPDYRLRAFIRILSMFCWHWLLFIKVVFPPYLISFNPVTSTASLCSRIHCYNTMIDTIGWSYKIKV